MQLKIYLILLFVVLGLTTIGQQVKKGFYNSLDEAIADSGLVKNLYLDFNIEEESVFIEKIGIFPKLESLTIINYEQKDLPPLFYNLIELDSIIISDCPKLNFRVLFKNLTSLQSLTYLELDGNDLREIPEDINRIPKLKTLRITNNDNLLLSETVEILRMSSTLTELALPVNDITELPDNIGSLKQIHVLDLSNNYLSDLPDSIAGMSGLIQIRLEGNNLVDPVNTTEKLKNLDIKYVSLDKGLTSDEINRLKTVFPDCEIKEINTSVTPIENNLLAQDTINIPDINISSKADNTTDSVAYGTFQVEQSDFVALSTAYLHYPTLIRNPLLKVDFDSLLFDERYRDTNYCNTTRINRTRLQRNADIYNYLYIEPVKSKIKKGIWFKFVFSELNSEISAFTAIWAYTGGLSMRQFRKTYIKSGWFRQKYWLDTRFYYDDANKMFTVELKNKGGFCQLKACPANENPKITQETFQLKYAKLYSSYCRALDRRRRRFHKNLFRDKMIMDKNFKKNKERLWDGFRKMYMSPDEKKMTMEEWLKYYDKVIAHEKKILYAATADGSTIKRSLELNEYEAMSQGQWISENNCTYTINATFEDKSGNNLAVMSVIIIDKENRCFYSVPGSVGLGGQLLMLCNQGNIRIIVELRNGDIGIVLQEELADKNLFRAKKGCFKVQIIPKSLCTVGQVMDLSGL